MREIKFRAWNARKNLMTTKFEPTCISGTINDELYYITSGQISLELMQYTGLKDSKGTEIYEGDIVYIAGKGNVEVKFDICGYWSFGYCEDYQDIIEDLEQVVGNIYENPELK